MPNQFNLVVKRMITRKKHSSLSNETLNLTSIIIIVFKQSDYFVQTNYVFHADTILVVNNFQ